MNDRFSRSCECSETTLAPSFFFRYGIQALAVKQLRGLVRTATSEESRSARLALFATLIGIHEVPSNGGVSHTDLVS